MPLELPTISSDIISCRVLRGPARAMSDASSHVVLSLGVKGCVTGTLCVCIYMVMRQLSCYFLVHEVAVESTSKSGQYMLLKFVSTAAQHAVPAYFFATANTILAISAEATSGWLPSEIPSLSFFST